MLSELSWKKKGAIRDFAWITLFFYHTPLIQALIPLLEVSLEKLAFLFLCLSVRKAHSIYILHSKYERKTTYYHIFSSFLEKFCNQGCNDMSRYHRSQRIIVRIPRCHGYTRYSLWWHSDCQNSQVHHELGLGCHSFYFWSCNHWNIVPLPSWLGSKGPTDHVLVLKYIEQNAITSLIINKQLIVKFESELAPKNPE